MTETTAIQETKVLWDRSANKLYVWDRNTNAWELFALAANIVTTDDLLSALEKIDGAGSGLDADLLDGQGGAYYLSWANLSGTPASFPPAAHSHAMADVTGLQAALDAKLGTSSYTAADVLAKIKTVDGSGSGLDADMLDGRDSGYFTDIPSRLGYTPANKAGESFTGNISTAGTIAGASTLTLNSLVLSVSGGNLFVASSGKVWTSDNDGSGSGLDADTLDGHDSSYFAPAGTTDVAHGGTGQTALAAHDVLVGAGSAAVALVGSASGGTVFQGASGADPFFTANPIFGVAGSVAGSLTLASSTGGSTKIQPQTTASGTLTLPAATDTLVGRATTDTLTNKSFDTAATGNRFYVNGTSITDKTGSGKVVLDTSPSLTTPSIGGVGLSGSGGNLYIAATGKVWTSDNDGSGSGLDADTLDGQDSGYFTNIPARLGYTPANKAGESFTGNISTTGTIAGGSTLTLNSLVLSVSGGNLFVASSGKVWTSDNDGSGSGLDADTLDGRDSGWFADIPSRLGYTPFNAAGGTITGNTAISGTLSVGGAVTFNGTVTMPGGGRLISQTAFIANGTWTKGTGTRFVFVYCLGGGGGGGGAQGGANNGAGGGGGGAGALAVKWIDVTAVSTVAVTVGGGGVAGSSAGGNGGSGGTSSFGTYCSAGGGSGGTGQSSGNYAQIVAGGYGGNASGGDFNFSGGAGAPGIRLDYQNGSAGRGAAAAMFGGGGNGYAGNADGQQGIARGDGGGGGVVANGATGHAGGAGATGLVWIWEYQ